MEQLLLYENSNFIGEHAIESQLFWKTIWCRDYFFSFVTTAGKHNPEKKILFNSAG